VDTFALVMAGDLVYCDPPYIDSQAILYGAQDFKFSELIAQIAKCKGKGAWVDLSIDGTKKSGRKVVKLNIPDHLFKREIYISSGSSMLKRFQNGGELMIGEDVADRLLLTW
jgi:DNA adenine methylase